MTVDVTLKARGAKYGPFHEQAAVEQDIKVAMYGAKNYRELRDDQKSAIEMFAVKISRILCGDPDYIDNWHDIGGYAKLVEDRLRAQEALDSVSDDSIFEALGVPHAD